jgi:hypothetical protein
MVVARKISALHGAWLLVQQRISNVCGLGTVELGMNTVPGDDTCTRVGDEHRRY